MKELQIEAELRLFNAYTYNKNELGVTCLDRLTSLSKGIIYSDDVPEKVDKIATNMYGLDGKKLNQTFHKSFNKVITTDISQLVLEQVVHYFTTYGFGILGIFNQDTVYIPHEQLDIPDLEKDIEFKQISFITPTTLQSRLMLLGMSGVALSKQTIEDMLELSDYMNLDDIDSIKNKELRIALYSKYNLVPKTNVEFMRYMCYKLANNTLLIKDKATISAFKNCNKIEALYLINRYISTTKEGMISLAEIFLRYKPLFIALKSDNVELNKIINRISKLSKKYHKPLKSNILENITQIKTHKECIKLLPTLKIALEKTTTFKLIKLINTINLHKIQHPNSVYRIRNGSTFIKSNNDALNIIDSEIRSILFERLSSKLQGKTIYIPSNVEYTVPTSEKQFIGNIPINSYITLPIKSNLLVGIHWENVIDEEGDERQVDLDLSAISRDIHIGWNASYKSINCGVVFSGDQTNAPISKNGASEFILVQSESDIKDLMFSISNYTYGLGDIKYQLIIGETNSTKLDKNYIIDPNDIRCLINTLLEVDNISHKATKGIGLAKIEKDNVLFVFNDGSINVGNYMRDSSLNIAMYEYMRDEYANQMTLRDLLTMCDARLISDAEYESNISTVDFDLSLNKLSKDTLINLLAD